MLDTVSSLTHPAAAYLMHCCLLHYISLSPAYIISPGPGRNLVREQTQGYWYDHVPQCLLPGLHKWQQQCLLELYTANYCLEQFRATEPPITQLAVSSQFVTLRDVSLGFCLQGMGQPSPVNKLVASVLALRGLAFLSTRKNNAKCNEIIIHSHVGEPS